MFTLWLSYHETYCIKQVNKRMNELQEHLNQILVDNNIPQIRISSLATFTQDQIHRHCFFHYHVNQLLEDTINST